MNNFILKSSQVEIFAENVNYCSKKRLKKWKQFLIEEIAKDFQRYLFIKMLALNRFKNKF